MKRKILFQVGVLFAAFFLIGLLTIGFLVYAGSTSLFLKAKNEMIDRDLNHIREQIMYTPALSSMLDYWKKNKDSIKEVYTPEESEYYSRYYEWEEKGFTDSDFAGFPETAKSAFAKDYYFLMCRNINSDKAQFDYKAVYIMDISESDIGFIYCSGNSSDKYDFGSIGLRRKIDKDRHYALKKILSGQYESTEYEVFDDPDSGSLYIGYAPVECEGTAKCAVCVEYDWSSFRRALVENMLIMIIFGIAAEGVLVLILLLYLRRKVIDPITQMQKSVRQYMTAKNSADVSESMSRINADNELGVLASDIAELTAQTDEHIKVIENSHKAVKKLTAEVMDALAQAIDAKDEYTNGHSERVAIYSKMIARKLGLSEDDQEKIYYMGLLHDIGKIGIPKSIINKTSRLTDEEFALIQSHPILGFEILEKIQSEPDLALAARWHHEYINGKGYPDGKKGDEIPLLVRIIAVADSYDAMTSNRSYRQYLPQEVARSEIEKNIGTQFDPQAAKCMLDIIDADKQYALHE